MNQRSFINFIAVIFAGVFLAAGVQAKNGVFLNQNLMVPPPMGTQTASNLVYFGGPVISKVKVVSIHWSSDVDPIFKNNMADFYTDYVRSPAFTWVSEFGTNVVAQDGREGTNQQIFPGDFLKEVTITPQNQSQRLTDEQIQAELKYQINNSVLPAPDENTLYMIHFPSRIKITIEGMMSCQTFGGYHNNGDDAKLGSIRYSVLPDCSAPSATYEQRLRIMTFVASHELMESVTDPIPTPGDNPSYPQAWNTVQGAEIADLCYGSVKMHGAKRDYDVTMGWSNVHRGCYGGN